MQGLAKAIPFFVRTVLKTTYNLGRWKRETHRANLEGSPVRHVHPVGILRPSFRSRRFPRWFALSESWRLSTWWILNLHLQLRWQWRLVQRSSGRRITVARNDLKKNICPEILSDYDFSLGKVIQCDDGRSLRNYSHSTFLDELPAFHAIHVYCYKSRLQKLTSFHRKQSRGKERSRRSLEFTKGNDTFIDLERSLIVLR